MFATFSNWTNEGDDAKIEPVLTKFATYCQPRKSIPFERYCFNRRTQQPGETYEQYQTALRKLADSCNFRSITPDEILRDRLVFGIADDKVRKTLLREPKLTLTRTDEICRASEAMNEQMKTICSPTVRPLLGHKACLTMKVIAYLDNDKLNKPDTSQTTVLCTIDCTGLSSIEQVVKNFPTVFGSGIGKLNGEYHIKLAAQVTPVQHAPRRVPMAIRDHLKRADIIVPITEPTQWISSMVVVPKKNGTLRICLDPKNLNAAIQREHYPLPAIEDTATCLYGAKVFTVLDVYNVCINH